MMGDAQGAMELMRSGVCNSQTVRGCAFPAAGNSRCGCHESHRENREKKDGS
jgi:hypothetical protein